MNEAVCQHLDSFLSGTLNGPESATFAAHLAECAACRLGVEEHDRLNQLLRIASAELETLPPGFAVRMEIKLRRSARRRVVRWATALTAAAAAVLAAVGLWQIVPPSDTPAPPALVDKVLPTAPLDQPASVRVIFPEEDDVIAVRAPSSNPKITIIWVYPAEKTAQQPEPTDPTNETPERNGL